MDHLRAITDNADHVDRNQNRRGHTEVSGVKCPPRASPEQSVNIIHDADTVAIASIGECFRLALTIATAADGLSGTINLHPGFITQVQLTVVIEGRYRVLVTIHSFVKPYV